MIAHMLDSDSTVCSAIPWVRGASKESRLSAFEHSYGGWPHPTSWCPDFGVSVLDILIDSLWVKFGDLLDGSGFQTIVEPV